MLVTTWTNPEQMKLFFLIVYKKKPQIFLARARLAFAMCSHWLCWGSFKINVRWTFFQAGEGGLVIVKTGWTLIRARNFEKKSILSGGRGSWDTEKLQRIFTAQLTYHGEISVHQWHSTHALELQYDIESHWCALKVLACACMNHVCGVCVGAS